MSDSFDKDGLFFPEKSQFRSAEYLREILVRDIPIAVSECEEKILQMGKINGTVVNPFRGIIPFIYQVGLIQYPLYLSIAWDGVRVIPLEAAQQIEHFIKIIQFHERAVYLNYYSPPCPVHGGIKLQ